MFCLKAQKKILRSFGRVLSFLVSFSFSFVRKAQREKYLLCFGKCRRVLSFCLSSSASFLAFPSEQGVKLEI